MHQVANTVIATAVSSYSTHPCMQQEPKNCKLACMHSYHNKEYTCILKLQPSWPLLIVGIDPDLLTTFFNLPSTFITEFMAFFFVHPVPKQKK